MLQYAFHTHDTHIATSIIECETVHDLDHHSQDDAIIMVEYTAPSLPDPSAYQYASIFVTEKDAATGKYCSSDCIHSDYRAKYKVGDGALVEDMAKAIEAKPGQKVID